MNLIHIVTTLHEIEKAILENNGELTPELEQALSIETMAKEKKIDAYHAIMERCRSIETELKAKIDLISTTIKNTRKIEQKLKYNLKQAMLISAQPEINGEFVRYLLVDQGSKLEVTDETLIPHTYFKEVTTTELDKENLKKDLEQGAMICGATLEPVRSLRSYAPKVKELK